MNAEVKSGTLEDLKWIFHTLLIVSWVTVTSLSQNLDVPIATDPERLEG